MIYLYCFLYFLYGNVVVANCDDFTEVYQAYIFNHKWHQWFLIPIIWLLWPVVPVITWTARLIRSLW